MDNFNEQDVQAAIVNPFYAVNLQKRLFDSHEPNCAKEDWVIKNAQLMKEMGVRDWLEELLKALTSEPDDSPTHTVINPANAIMFSNRWNADHEPLVARKMWVDANETTIKQDDTVTWLWRLLDVLETGTQSDSNL